MNRTDIVQHCDLLIEEDNNPVWDTSVLQEYMNKWDGIDFINELQLDGKQNVLEVGIGTGRLALKVLSISKEESTEIDCGNRKLKIYPDNLHDIIAYLSKTNLKIIKQFETEFAWVVVCVK